MKEQTRAVIDVGTNSVKLLVAEVSGRTVRPVYEQSEQTRLGRGFYETRRLSGEAIELTARAVAAYKKQAEEWGAAAPRVIATSAARDAVNPEELVSTIRKEAELDVEILSGEQEADWVFRGVTTDPALSSLPLLILDVGGGSTEFILGRDAHHHFRGSFPLGTVRLLEQNRWSDPPAAADWASCREQVSRVLDELVAPALHNAFEKIPAGQLQLIGTGGTATILTRLQFGLMKFERHKIDGAVLTREDVTRQRERLWSLPLEERRKLIGMPSKRADVIAPGAAIYEAILSQFGFHGMRVSTRGLRYAAVMD